MNVRRNTGAPAATDVGTIAFQGSNTNGFELVLGASALLTSPSLEYTAAGFRNWEGLAATVPPSLANVIRLGGRISGSLNGPVSVGLIYRLQLDGAINDLLAANLNNEEGFFRIDAASGSANAVIQRESGDIYAVTIGTGTTGDYLGTIRALNGDVVTAINVAGDCLCEIEIGEDSLGDGVGVLPELTVGKRLGTSASPAFVGVYERIVDIEAGEISAAITGPPGRPRTRNLVRVETTAANGTTGRVAGLIQTGTATNYSGLGYLDLAGPFEARMDISNGMLSAEFFVDLPANGLQGQILMDVEGGTPNFWTSPVTIGTTTLSPPHYSNTAASLGGGTVGLAPFDLHGADCGPPDGSSIPLANTPGPTNPIRIRHYGPITYDTDETPVVISALIDGGTEYAQNACLIPATTDVEIDSTNDTILVVTPAIPLPNGFIYRIRPKVVQDDVESLYCDIHSGKVVAAWEYEICVGDEHPADINLDDAVNAVDFNILASNFRDTGCFLPGDLDASGTVNADDFNILAGHFNQTDIPACGGGALQRGGMSPFETLISEMGFESPDDFSAWIDELPEEDQLEMLGTIVALLSE